MPVLRPPKVLLVGWDAADWKVIRPLVAQGSMPAVASLLREGSHGNLATLYPALSPMLWTSIATGQRPYKHGIHGFTEPAPDGQSVRPITVLSRKVKAIWNILNQNGRRCNVVGWWPSHPAEPLNGVMISNHYHRAATAPGQPWPVLPGMVHPPSLALELGPLRLHPTELGEEHLRPFIPRANEIDQSRDEHLLTLAKLVADCTNVHAAVTYLLQHEPADFTAVYFDALDHFGHAFMRYHPPRLEWVPEKDFDLYHEVVAGAYRYHDMMLGVLLDMVGPDCTVVLMSDHGFHSDHLRPTILPSEPAGPSVEHRHHGIFAIRGPGIKPGGHVAGASVLDVAPTVLHLFGLPVGRDFDGRVLVEAFTERREPEFIPTWESVTGPERDGRHPPETRVDAGDFKTALDQLVALGYVARPSEDASQAVQSCLDELHYNLARSYMDAGLHVHAVPLLEDLFERCRDEVRHGLLLARCLLALGRTGQAREIFERTVIRKHEISASALDELRKIKAEGFAPERETERAKVEAAYLRLRDLRGKAGINAPMIHLIRAMILQAAGDANAALAELESARANGTPRASGFQLQLGDTYLALKRFPDAEAAFHQAIDLDPENAEAHHGLARMHLLRRQSYPAASAALTAVELQPFFPAAHFALGIALARLRQRKPAADALRACLRQNPNHAPAHLRLAKLLAYMGDTAGSSRHRVLAREARLRVRELRAARGLPPPQPLPVLDALAPSPPNLAAPFHLPVARDDRKCTDIITLVSGLPRSGTSLVMQMLGAGGLELFTDGIRAADRANLRGYFEHEKVKNLARDATWIREARGRVVKIVAPLLPFVPPGFRYRVIFVERDLDEVLASQTALLALQGSTPGDQAALRRAFRQHVATALALLARHPHISHLIVRHAAMLAEPARVAAHLNAFLGGGLDEARMAAVVDPSLHRQRQPKATLEPPPERDETSTGP